jgi:signal transduction histidine kinase
MAARIVALYRWGRRRIDVVQMVALFTLGSLLLATGQPLIAVVVDREPLPPGHWLHLATLTVACLCELLRERAPAVGLGIGLALLAVEVPFGISISLVIVVGDLLFAATLHGSKLVNRVIIWTVGLVVVVVVVVSISRAHQLSDVMLTVLQLCGIPVLPVWWAMNVRQHREIAREQKARADQLVKINELDRKTAIADERSRMARDLHDVIAGHLSAIAIQSEAVLSMVDSDPARVRRVLQAVRENSVASLTEMHAMIRVLRAEDQEYERTAPARLRDLGILLESARASGVDVTAEVTDEELPVAVDLSAYRIVQEALTNVAKHAPGGRAEVRVGREGDRLVVEVTNERGNGRPAAPGSGRGLLNMRERAQAVGGVLEAGPRERDWRVRAELPAEAVE